MRFAITVILAVATGVAALSSAQAKLTPFDGAREAKPADPVVLYTGPAAAELERNYFTPPQTEAAQIPGRCTVQSFVFAKKPLADACY